MTIYVVFYNGRAIFKKVAKAFETIKTPIAQGP